MSRKRIVSVKDLNKKNILRIIINKDFITRTNIANLLKISRPTASSYINDLIEEGFVIEKGKSTPSSVGGKKASLLHFNSNAKYIIGMRVGERILKAAITDLSSNIIKSKSLLTEEWKGHKHVIKKILLIIKELIKESNINKEKIIGIGIGCTGLVDRQNGTVIFSPNLKGWKNINLRQIIENETHIKTYIENDVRMETIAEKNHGLAKGINSFICFSTGIGIGTGIVINNRLMVGKNGLSGEVGHLVTNIESNKYCHCGNIGCLETLCNTIALINDIKKDIAEGKQVSVKLKKDFQIEDIYPLYKSGEEVITDNVNKNARYIGIGVSNALKFFNPEMVIIRGKYVGFGQKYLEVVRDTVKKYTFPKVPFKYNIEFSKLGDNAIIIGSSSLVFEEEFLNINDDLRGEYLLKKI
jgi:predicted NBD/HSP70 family sugar kinase